MLVLVHLEMLVNLGMSAESCSLRTPRLCLSDPPARWMWIMVVWVEEQAEKTEVGHAPEVMVSSAIEFRGECGLQSGCRQQAVMTCA